MRNMILLKGAKRILAAALTSALVATMLPGNFGGDNGRGGYFTYSEEGYR